MHRLSIFPLVLYVCMPVGDLHVIHSVLIMYIVKHDLCFLVFEELYGFTGTNAGDLEPIPKQCQLAPDIPQFTQVFSLFFSCQYIFKPFVRKKLMSVLKLCSLYTIVSGFVLTR